MIRVSRQGAVATLALHRPEARNAVSIAGWHALAEAAGDLAASDARVVLLVSDTPGIFSAGADIGAFEALRADAGARTEFREAMRAAIEALAALPMPCIAVVDGGCYGAAVALALACDLRVAGPDAQFATTPARLGIGYPRADVARLVAAIGRGNAARMLFTGDPIDAAEAHRIGLVELRGTDAGALAHMLAGRIAANGPHAVRLLKRTLDRPDDPALDSAFDAAFGGAEFAEGLAAFRERRGAQFA